VEGMKGNLEESKNTWFNLLFGVKPKSNADSADMKLLKEQRKKALDKQEKKMKMENMILILSKFRLDTLK
jgi:hypothetical protein